MWYDLFKKLESIELCEGLASARRNYSGKVNSGLFSYFDDSDPTKNKKYLEWMLASAVAHPGEGGAEVDGERIVNAAWVFNNLAEKGLIANTDIYQYSLEDVEKTIKVASKKTSKTQKKKDIKKEEADAVYEDDRLLILDIKTLAASKIYGAGTRWCTTSEEWWQDYVPKGIRLYYIIDKINNNKFGVAIAPDGSVYDVRNARDDDEWTMADLEKQIGKLPKGILKPAPPMKKKKKFRKPKTVEGVLKTCIKNPDGTYSSEGDVNFNKFGLTKIPVQFKEVAGDFFIDDNKLTTLKGSPAFVGKEFSCGDNQIKSLQYGPKKVQRLNCFGNQLTSLKYCPEVAISINVGYNRLHTLKGAPKHLTAGIACGGNGTPVEDLAKTIKVKYPILSYTPSSFYEDLHSAH